MPKPSPSVAVLTGGGDKPYALGLAASLIAQDVSIDFIGSNEVDGPELHQTPLVRFLNLRGDQDPKASTMAKVWRVLIYYVRLLRYAAFARPKIFHILWNNKIELFDRTLLMLYYRVLGKRVVFTVHNVNARWRDGNDTLLNRLTLKIQYRLANHLFVHTAQMKRELETHFAVAGNNVTIIPFGINATVPRSNLTPAEAKHQLGLTGQQKVVLFFGNIAPYKGVELLVEAFAELSAGSSDYRLIIAGRPKDCLPYWEQVQQLIRQFKLHPFIIERIQYVPDEDTEIYFKAADVLVLPYTHIFQSGVLFLGYNFGLPVIASDVGSLREDIEEGRTGYICRPKDPGSLAEAFRTYFASDLYRGLGTGRQAIQDFANERYSWEKVGVITRNVYEQLN